VRNSGKGGKAGKVVRSKQLFYYTNNNKTSLELRAKSLELFLVASRSIQRILIEKNN